MDGTRVSPTPPHTRPGPRLRSAWWLSGLVAALTVVAATAGLLDDGLYSGPAALVARIRGNDLATLVAGVPLLVVALVAAVRGSSRGSLVWVGMLAYSIYNYAYYVYDPAFNDLFLVHVVIVVLSAAALGLALTDLDVAVRARVAMRWVGGLLLLLAATLAGMYGASLVRQAVSGVPPADVLPLPQAQVHLGMALDLTMVVPTSVLAGVLLWRRSAWGHALGVATCVYVGMYQLNYLVARYFVAQAGVQGVAYAEPLDLLIPALLLAAVLALVVPRREGRPRAVRLPQVPRRVRPAAHEGRTARTPGPKVPDRRRTGRPE
ncbi:hypothetical protein [Nonomuraea gerenzanensis]|uniref:Uncharacterized protein n=1 Tax=Nonomuraea gerenzanensis TaxID=93944 RepID=A0A1M4EAZ6_9ACTN|nr:hypothetical protein [Nonomuraea gerenzanensis]UBU18291.1 hypothetical protein LCN96_25685 [Nonomuraea gerenzanensis]SBO96111.1 Function Code:14.00-Unknown [Nonomuraea gerenzanensis]